MFSNVITISVWRDKEKKLSAAMQFGWYNNNNLLVHVEVASKLGDVEILNWFKNVLGYFSHYLLRCTQSIWKRWLLLQHRFYVEWIVCLWCVPILELLFIKSSIIFPLYGDWQRWINWSVVSFFWTMINSKFLYLIITTQKCLM